VQSNGCVASASRFGLSRLEWGAFALALIIAHAFYARSLIFPSAFDSQYYRIIATDIGNVGPFAKFAAAHLRSYGYPLFLLALEAVAEVLHVPWGLVAFEVQLALYVAAALALRGSIAIASPRLARIVFIALALNPFALLYTTDTLTESLSITLIVLAAACWTRMLVVASPSWTALAVGSFAIGLAIVVRPGNVFALPAWIAGAFVIAWIHRRNFRQRMLGALIVIAFLALPMAPQVANNVSHFGKWTPLITANLGRFQMYWGVQSLKYASGLPPIAHPSIYYENPFVQGRPVDYWHPRDWYLQYPVAGIATMALHVFGMLDQDLLFTYARDLDPWYRRPLGVLTHGTVALAVLALGLLGWRSRHDRNARAIAVTVAALVVPHVALHASTAVEMRFGLPLLVLAAPLAGWFVSAFWPAASLRQRGLVASFVLAWIVGSLVLSDWIRHQAPQIVAWEAGVPYVPKPD
jgi:hypothetical protein